MQQVYKPLARYLCIRTRQDSSIPPRIPCPVESLDGRNLDQSGSRILVPIALYLCPIACPISSALMHIGMSAREHAAREHAGILTLIWFSVPCQVGNLPGIPPGAQLSQPGQLGRYSLPDWRLCHRGDRVGGTGANRAQ